jgi:hypothetical protein
VNSTNGERDGFRVIVLPDRCGGTADIEVSPSANSAPAVHAGTDNRRSLWFIKLFSASQVDRRRSAHGILGKELIKYESIREFIDFGEQHATNLSMACVSRLAIELDVGEGMAIVVDKFWDRVFDLAFEAVEMVVVKETFGIFTIENKNVLNDSKVCLYTRRRTFANVGAVGELLANVGNFNSESLVVIREEEGRRRHVVGILLLQDNELVGHVCCMY